MADCQKVSKEALLAAIRKQGALYAPGPDGSWLAYTDQELPEIGSIRPKRPIRDLFIPPVREIATWEKHVSQAELKPAEVDTSRATVFGVRPCDARALSWLDKIFLAEPYVDPHYKAKRENMLLVGLACEPESSCHCGLFDFGPDESSEMDVMLYPQDGAFLIVSASNKGRQFIASIEGSEPADSSPDATWTQTGLVDPIPQPEALLENFENPVWDELQIGCMNCGACTLYCPTCQCFTITDETYKNQVKRQRVVDTCQHSDFTRMAGGHNPRTKRHSRLRQRVMHKFGYIPMRNDGEMGCSGCGRCVELCGLRRHLFADLVEVGKRISSCEGV